jgi:hypothetical protein
VAAKEALLTILAKVKEEELPVLRFVRELILVLYLYRIMVSIRCSKMSDLAIRRRYISDEAYNSEGGKASFSENLNKVYGAFDNAFDSSFKKISFFVHI